MSRAAIAGHARFGAGFRARAGTPQPAVRGASLGFLLAWRARAWVTLIAIVALEVGLALWVRDNLTLNIIMLVHPIDAVRAWQTAGCPLPWW